MDRPHGLPSHPAPHQTLVRRNGTTHNPTELADKVDDLALEPPTRFYDDRKRESTLDSADQAEGIFDLYERDRDSWRDSGHHLNGNDRPAALDTRLNTDAQGSAGREELVDDPASPVSWDGPFSALARPQSQAQPHPQAVSLMSDSRRSSFQPVNGSNVAPGIMVTPDKSLYPGRDVPRHQRESTISASTSTSASINGMAGSPSRPGGGGGGGGGDRLSPRHAVSRNGSASTSQVSVAASSQYPGEDNDAFHVRSTYARLEAEGVHGDGWDPGVERTRGGPAHGKRATMFEATKAHAVGEAEKDFLATLDRYGFINEPLRNRSETRLALIPAAPLLKIPKLPSTSPIPPNTAPPPPPSFGALEGPPPKTPATPKTVPNEQSRSRRKEEERVGKWMKMMSVKKRDQGGNTVQWGWKSDMRNKVGKRVYKGVPDRWRMAAWWTLAEEQVSVHKGKGRETRPAEILAQEYRDSIDLPSTHDVQIDLDVPRTISGHTLFVTRYGAGQRSLFHVLHCFSLSCDTCGYCQGMGPIAATLLCYFDPERVYALLVRLHDVYGMHSIFAPGFPGLLEAFYVQERLMEYLMPDVYKSFQRNMISSSAWGTKWYITLFVNTVPFSQQLRLWDALWLEGRDVMVMTAIAILWSFKDLLSAPNATFESILSLLSSYFVAEDEDAFLRFIRKMLAQPGLRQRMDTWRSDWHKLVAEGKSGTALL